MEILSDKGQLVGLNIDLFRWQKCSSIDLCTLIKSIKLISDKGNLKELQLNLFGWETIKSIKTFENLKKFFNDFKSEL